MFCWPVNDWVAVVQPDEWCNLHQAENVIADVRTIQTVDAAASSSTFLKRRKYIEATRKRLFSSFAARILLVLEGGKRGEIDVVSLDIDAGNAVS